MITKEETNNLPAFVRRITTVGANDLTFEEGVYLVQYLISTYALRIQAENDSPEPDPGLIAEYNETMTDLAGKRDALIVLWKLIIGRYQNDLAQFFSLLTVDKDNPN